MRTSTTYTSISCLFLLAFIVSSASAKVRQCPWYLPDFITWFANARLKSRDIIVFGENAVVYKVTPEAAALCDTSNGDAVLQDENGYNTVILSQGIHCYLQSQQLCMEGLKLCVKL